ncbi:CD63 antigen [Bacillus rossius redtenbacheri]|uniref:CD63 antigen n=1 Tax=Bacillus rossius redtenbacheri TaxID=93214 RepID=UPI002FDCC765
METCGMSIMKYLLFIFNFLFVVCGIGIVAAGGVVLYAVREHGHFMTSPLLATPVVIIIVGCLIFLVAFLGCCGAVRESYNMLLAFAVLLLVIFVAQMAAGIAAGVAKDDLSRALKDSMRDSMDDAAHAREADVEAWDRLQKELKCCGVDGPGDWTNMSQPVPASCCDEGAAECKAAAAHPRGCLEKLKASARDGAVVIAGVGIGLAFVEVVGIVFAFCLATAIKNGEAK